MHSVSSKIHSLIVYLCSKRNNCTKSNTHFSIVCCVPVTYYVLYICVRFVFMIIVYITAELERKLIHHNNVLTQPRPNFTIKDLPSVLILIIGGFGSLFYINYFNLEPVYMYKEVTIQSRRHLHTLVQTRTIQSRRHLHTLVQSRRHLHTLVQSRRHLHTLVQSRRHLHTLVQIRRHLHTLVQTRTIRRTLITQILDQFKKRTKTQCVRFDDRATKLKLPYFQIAF